jgi:hypothetical protein
VSEAVLSDVQVSGRRVVRPFPDFEAQYEALSGDTPILFYPTRPDDTQEIAASHVRREAYDPRLAAALPVPLGSRVRLWIPVAVTRDTTAATPPYFYVSNTYQYRITWRLRDHDGFVADARGGNLLASHQPTVQGRVSTVPPPAAARNAIPAAYDPGGVLTVPASAVDPAVLGPLPLRPSIAPEYQVTQQGIFDPGELSIFPSQSPAMLPTFTLHELVALGDEMLIEARKTSVAPWGFGVAGADTAFSYTFGSNVAGSVDPLRYGAPALRTLALGIYVMTQTGG